MQEIATMKDTVDIMTNIRSLPFADVYDVSAEIGRGKFAVVKRCKHKTSGKEYAAKYLKKRRKGKDCKKEVLHEVHMLELAITHPHIITVVEVYETNLDLIIVTDFAKGGELFEHIMAEGQLEESVTIRLLRQILDGLSFLHANNIAHLDVKPQNILLTDALPHGDIKLCDFGLARLFNCGHDILEIIGTPDYVAPEVLDYKPLGSACDMWSIGVLTYVMLTGCSPFAGDTTQETYLNISQVNLDFPDELFENISKDAMNFMRSVLIKDPLDRLTARQCLNHAWFQTSEPSLPVISVGSPSGQRRSVEATKDPDFHKPIKKSRCDMNSEDEAQSRHNTDTNENEQKKENLHSVPEKSSTTSKPLSTGFDATQPVSTSFDTTKPVSASFSAAKTVSTTKSKFNSLDLPNSVPSDLKENDLPGDSVKCCEDCQLRRTHVSSMTWSRELGEVMVLSASFDAMPEKSNTGAKMLSTSFDAKQPVSTSFDSTKPVSASFSAAKVVSTAKSKLDSPNSVPSDLTLITWSREMGEVMV